MKPHQTAQQNKECRRGKTVSSSEEERNGFTTTSERSVECSYSAAASTVGATSAAGKSGADVTREEVAKVNAEGAFTLIELIVALGVFTIVVTMVAAGLLSVIDASSRTQNLTGAVNSLNFVLDDMTRRMRIGYNFECGGGGDCTGGAGNLQFRISRVGGAGNDPIVSYQLDEERIQRSTDGGPYLNLTSDELTIENLEFYVIGAEKNIDGEQTRIVVAISGSVGGDDATAEDFSMQTTIAQRLLFSPQEN